MKCRLVSSEVVIEFLPPEMGKLRKLRNIDQIAQRILNAEGVKGITFNDDVIHIQFYAELDTMLASKQKIEDLLKEELI